MTLTTEQAKAIIEAFGPCTSVYECREPAELVEDALDFSDLATLVCALFKAEEIFLEQRGNQWSGENEKQFRAEVADDKRFLAAVWERLWLFLRDAAEGGAS